MSEELKFEPMRSLIYINVPKEEYRHKLLNWLYGIHVPDSISQFEPYVTKYAFYQAMPVPECGERFGTYNFQLTEHHWLINPMNPILKIKALSERVYPDPLKWQGIIPDDDKEAGFVDADAVRSAQGDSERPPFVFAFLPMWWEEDIKGEGRTVDDGANYRWQMLIHYPEGVSAEEGDEWLLGEVLPKFAEMDEVTRILSSKVKQDVNGCLFHRAVEIWTDGPEEWFQAAVVKSKCIAKPSWATEEVFPYLKPKFEIASIFITDVPTSNNLQQYRGLMTIR